MDRTKTINRMKTVEGHVSGIRRMLEEDEYCIDVIRQIQAVQSALSKVSKIVLEDHMDSCMTTAIRGDNPAERERVLNEIVEVFEAATK